MPMSTPSWAPSRTSLSNSERNVMRTMPRRTGGWVKRSFDVATSLVLLVLLSPLLLLCGAAVWVADGWPVLFRHERVRRYGRRFHIVKFRTMDHTGGGDLTVAGDPRVTATGRLLRRHKLDELPQLWNVLVGEMSFVGPRPEVARYVAMYARPYRTIHQLRPGITDFASLAFRDEEQLLYAHTADAGFYERMPPPSRSTRVISAAACSRIPGSSIDVNIVCWQTRSKLPSGQGSCVAEPPRRSMAGASRDAWATASLRRSIPASRSWRAPQSTNCRSRFPLPHPTSRMATSWSGWKPCRWSSWRVAHKRSCTRETCDGSSNPKNPGRCCSRVWRAS